MTYNSDGVIDGGHCRQRGVLRQTHFVLDHHKIYSCLGGHDISGATVGVWGARAAVIAASLRLERSHSLGGVILMNGHT
ncbi:hypothetical protein DK871_17680 [Pseudomonas sp. L13]|nr:hypothetical protein [Pseudomonas sp. L13]